LTIAVTEALSQKPLRNFGLWLQIEIFKQKRHRQKGREARLGADLAAVKAAADWGLGECDRLATARDRLERRCRGTRGNSRLPALADIVLSRPFVTANMAAAELNVSPRAALDMIAALDLRELTGRGRFRAWGV